MRAVVFAIAVLVPGLCAAADAGGAQKTLAYYPADALAKGVSGTATLYCKRTVHGALHDCALWGQTPSDAFFGLAALNLARASAENPDLQLPADVAGVERRIVFTFDARARSITPDVLATPVADLPAAKRRVAECMRARLATVKGVSNVALDIAPGAPLPAPGPASTATPTPASSGAPPADGPAYAIHARLRYDFRHKDGRQAPGDIDVTNLLEAAESGAVLVLPGYVPKGRDLNDMDLGLPMAAGLWSSQCLGDGLMVVIG